MPVNMRKSEEQMKKRNSNVSSAKREGFIAKLVSDYDIPPELLHGGCAIEIRGRNSMIIRGCRRIIKYSTERIIIKMCRQVIEITGKRLTCLSYLSGAIAVEGIIDSLSFCKRDETAESSVK